MNREQAFVALAHGQLMELFAKDLVQALEAEKFDAKIDFQTEQRKKEDPYWRGLKEDTPKTAYLHNHGYTPMELMHMPFAEKSQICKELSIKLGKSVVAE